MKSLCLVVLLLPLGARAEDPAQRFSDAYVALAKQAAEGLQKVAALVDPKDCGSVDKALPTAATALKEHEKLLRAYKDSEKGLTQEQIKAGARAAMQTMMQQFQQSGDPLHAATKRLKSFKAGCPAQADRAEKQLAPLIQPIPRG